MLGTQWCVSWSTCVFIVCGCVRYHRFWEMLIDEFAENWMFSSGQAIIRMDTLWKYYGVELAGEHAMCYKSWICMKQVWCFLRLLGYISWCVNLSQAYLCLLMMTIIIWELCVCVCWYATLCGSLYMLYNIIYLARNGNSSVQMKF